MFLNKKCRIEKRNKILLDSITLPDNGKLLDLSCGNGELLNQIHLLQPNLELYGIDVLAPNISHTTDNQSEINIQQFAATELPFPDENFDVIVCAMSLHHYDDLDSALAEIQRTVKASGKVYFMDIMPENKFSQKIYNTIGCFEPYHFEKFYTISEFLNHLKDSKLGLKKTFNTSGILKVKVLEFCNL